MTIVYSLVCPAVADSKGNRVSGCGKGWPTRVKDEKCSTCGEPGTTRGQYMEVDYK